jgi:hypothetical protein
MNRDCACVDQTSLFIAARNGEYPPDDATWQLSDGCANRAMRMTHFTLINLPAFSDASGALTVLDNALPFPILRVFWIYDADGQTRGGHRHHKTRQALIAVAGAVTIFMNDGIVSDTILLDQPSRCLLVEPKDWHTMTFGPGSMLLVLASQHYDRNDYIDEKYE